MIDPTRRSVLKSLGAAAVATGSIGTASAAPSATLRRFSDSSIANSRETVTQGNFAYVANVTGMGVVDWREPGRPKKVAQVDLNDEFDDPNLSIKDVKVDGDVAALANDTEDPGGIALYDVSDPTTPEFLSFYEPDPPANIHNCFVDGNYAYLALGEPWNVETDDGDERRDKVWIFGNAGVEIVDISDPANPTHASTWYLKDYREDYAKACINPCHDLYVQNDLVYGAFWDAGTIVLNASDPTDPQFVTQFGAAPNGNNALPPWLVDKESFGAWFVREFPLADYYAGDGNAHYVQPTPDGNYTFVGDEKFPNRLEDDPATEEYGGIRVFDTQNLNDVQQVAYIAPPDVDAERRTSHNFDVKANKLHASWYGGGVRVYDITDPTNPVEEAVYDPDGVEFWTAVAERGFTVGGAYGGGVTFLHQDRGARQPPAFSSDDPPHEPEVDPRDAAE